MAFPATALNVLVEAALGADLTAAPSTWSWTDVTAYVRVTDTEPIRISHGRPDGSIQDQPDTVVFKVDNRDGRWCAYNPSGAWFGRIGRGTPIRFTVNEGTASIRATVFIVALPPTWDVSENDCYVKVTAAGTLRRLGIGNSPLHSAIARAFSGTAGIFGASSAPVAYWPGEDGAAALTLAEFFGGSPMNWAGGLSPSSDGPDGSEPLPQFSSDTSVRGLVSMTNTGQWTIAEVINIPTAVASATTILRWTTTGTYPVWLLALAPGSPDTLAIQAFDSAGTMQVNTSTAFTATAIEPYGQWLAIWVTATQSGADVNYQFFIDDGVGGTSQTGTATGITAGAVSSVGITASGQLDGVHAGHWAVWDVSTIDLASITPVLDGYAGDSAHIRAARLGAEQGLTVEVATDAQRMGPQPRATFLTNLRECQAIDGGRLIDIRDPTEFDSYLRLVMLSEITNRDADLALDHDQGHLAPGFEPQDDDLRLRNDWTAIRSSGTSSGSSARVVATDGRFTPELVGTYDDSVSVNVELDADLVHQAGWRVNLGTVEGLRFPQLVLNFARSPSLIPGWITCEVGSRVTVANPPAGMPPEDIDVVVEGWAEVLGPWRWDVVLNCSPFKPYVVGELATPTSDANAYAARLYGDEPAAIRAALTSSATTVDVDPNRFFFTLAADDFDPDPKFRLGGEVVSVSGVSTTAATFVAAGTAATDINASVTPALPAGATTGDLLLVFASIRNTAGVPNTPGYTRLPVFGASDNVQLFAKVHTGSESAPTVSFTGGVANATTVAQMAAFRGTPVTLTDLTDIVVGSLAQLNGSAANIAYPGLYPRYQERCIILALGWREQDWTSVATLSGFTEIGEPDSGGGDNAGIVWDYQIQTTPAVINEGSFVVTGGVNGISRGALVALASGYQTFTISARSVNGVTKAHTAGTRIATEDGFVLSL